MGFLRAVGVPMIVSTADTGGGARCRHLRKANLRSQNLPFTLPLMPALVCPLPTAIICSNEPVFHPRHFAIPLAASF